MSHSNPACTQTQSNLLQRATNYSFAGFLLALVLLCSPLLAQETAPSFSVRDLEGNRFALEGLRGKILVLNFWFVQCRPCVQEMPELNRLVQEHQGEEVVFLAFALNAKPEIETFLKKKTFDYHIIPAAQSVAEDYAVEGYPTHIIIDQTGKVAYRTVGLGLTTVSDLKQTLSALLAP